MLRLENLHYQIRRKCSVLVVSVFNPLGKFCTMINMDFEKEQFLKEFGDDYGYPNAPKNIDHIRATEFKRLNG